MLKSLFIKNYILIEELKINFSKGFNIITGETGAGKSIILDAIALLLGKRAETDVLYDNQKKCIIEAEIFTDDQEIFQVLADNDIDKDNNIILRREILPQSKSRSYVNDTPVKLSALKEIGEKLIDLHSQYENLSLSLYNYRLKIIDIAAGTVSLQTEYQNKFNKYSENKKLLQELEISLAEKLKDLDYYKFQYDQISTAKLNDDAELEELEQKALMLENAEEIKESLLKASDLIYDGEISALSLLKEVKILFGKLSGKYPKADELNERIDSVIQELKDISSIISEDAENSEINPELLENTNTRIDLINSLLMKHRVSSIKELKQKAEEFLSYITGTEDIENQIKSLQETVKSDYLQLVTIAEELSKKREAVFEKFSERIISSLVYLGIKDASFKVVNSKNSEPESSGFDNIEFLFSANKSMEMQSLSRVASGGEFSRLMLAFKSYIVKASGVSCVVFDEIDTGVSGEIALKMGKMMKELSSDIQVFAITHLPQIAALGDYHFKVYKRSDKLKTYTVIQELNFDERIKEIASMIGGDNISNQTIETAKLLLTKR
jgi:DNA repair protein RecN (Recombination protein N)